MTTSTVTVSTSPANRKEVAEAFGQNQSAVRRIESLTKDVTVNLPDAIDTTNAIAEQALALAQALQAVAYILSAPSSEVPSASVLAAGAGLTLSLAAGVITISLSIPVSVPHGGTGLATLPPHGVPVGNGVAVPNFAMPVTAGYVMTDNGPSADPSFKPLPTTVSSILAGTGISVSSSTGNVTVSLITPVTVPDGGTGANTATSALSNLGGVPLTSVGAINGVASLDIGGKVPTSQLPASVLGAMNYQGTWNASTNTPTIASGVGTKGFFYKVSVAGSTLIDGNSSWNVGDVIAFDGTTWDKFDGNSTEVSSVNGQVGAVTITPAGISAAATANNLSDLASASAARGNLGLGTAAIQAVSFFAQTANNLSDLANVATARTNLGLGTLATQNYATPPAWGGTTPNAVAATTISASGTITNTSTANALVAGTIPTVYPGNTVMIGQTSNANGCLILQRYTNTSPAGYLINAVNANNTGQLFSVDVLGNLITAGTLAFTPATTTTAPAAGGAGALPATPTGYAAITIGGIARKIAYY
jgi:hypothetical protein